MTGEPISAKPEFDRELGITGYSTNFLLNILEKYNNEYNEASRNRTVETVDAVDVSNQKGFLSRVFVLTITFSDGTEYKCAAKIPTDEYIIEGIKSLDCQNEEENKHAIAQMADVHNLECDALTLLSQIKDFPLANIYFVQKMNTTESCGLNGQSAPGMVLMSALSGGSVPINEDANHRQCRNVAVALAHLHCHILSLKPAEWYPLASSDFHIQNNWRSAWEQCVRQLVERRPGAKEASQVLYNLEISDFARYVLQELPKTMNAETLVLGDVYQNNVMFKRGENEQLTDEVEAFIDFQLAMIGNPMFDLARFICFGVNVKIWKTFIDDILISHHDRLSQLCKERCIDVPYTVETCRKLFDIAFAQQAYEGVTAMVFFTKNSGFGEGPDAEKKIDKIFDRTEEMVVYAAQVVKNWALDKKFPLLEQ